MQSALRFILELEKLKAVSRRTKPLGLERYENSAEHSWQLAVLALVLAEHANEPVDVARVIAMLLVHDIPEIDAGDTFAYAEAARAAQESVEAAAAERIFRLLPEKTGAELLGLWREFQANATAEARFANALDRLMPVLQNLHNDGQSWRENGVTREQVRAKTATIGHGSKVLHDATLELLEAAERGGLFD